MKRKRKSTAKAIEMRNKDKQIQEIQEMGPLITDLPKSVLQDVLINLPTKSIILCKSVCKAWYSLISDPEFAKLYLAQAEACPLLRPTRVSRTLYLVEPEDSSDFDLKDSACDYGTSKCIQFHLRMNFRKCKIRLRNADQATNAMLNRKRTTKRKPPPAAHETYINVWVMEDYGAQKSWMIHNLKQ